MQRVLSTTRTRPPRRRRSNVGKPTRRQRASYSAEVDKFEAYLADPRCKTDQHAAYADHYGQVLFVAEQEQER